MFLRKYVLVTVLAWITLGAWAQPPTGMSLRRDALREFGDTIIKRDHRPLFFRGVNLYDYYYDEARLRDINELGRKEEYLKAYDALHKYVTRFGIKNFHKDIFLIWKLGRLAQGLGYAYKAQQLYSLVLKHNRHANQREYRLYYDSLTRNDKDYYLPVEYYYTYAHAYANIDTLEIPSSTYTAMGDSVNSLADDYGPALAGNDLILLFTSKRNRRFDGPKVLENEDLYWTRKADSLALVQTDEGSKFDTIPWTRARPLPGGINTQYQEGSPCLSKNGKILFFARCQSPDGYGNCDIYVSVRQKNGNWGKAVNLGLNVNSQSWDSHPALSHHEDTLFFASDRLGGFGMSDIYYCFRTGYQLTEEGDTIPTWGRAQNLGPVINTRWNELSPFYHPIHEVLYFSSDGQLVNFGGLDIYKSYREYGEWSEPKNLGPLVNYKTDEYYFTIDSKARNLYYAKSVRKRVYDGIRGDTVWRDQLDLHQYGLPMEAQPEAKVTFAGAVTDSLTGKGFDGIVSIIDLDDGIEVAPKYLREDGSYRFDLIRNHNYLVIITGEDFFRIERQFLLTGDTTMNISTPSIKFKKWQFQAIKFGDKSANITEEMKPDLEKLVFFLADNPHLSLEISGHTDGRGNADDNVRLSQARADAIREYILDRGRFKPERIRATGYGFSRPVIPKEETEEHHRINRRVEFEIVKDK